MFQQTLIWVAVFVNVCVFGIVEDGHHSRAHSRVVGSAALEVGGAKYDIVFDPQGGINIGKISLSREQAAQLTNPDLSGKPLEFYVKKKKQPNEGWTFHHALDFAEGATDFCTAPGNCKVELTTKQLEEINQVTTPALDEINQVTTPAWFWLIYEEETESRPKPQFPRFALYDANHKLKSELPASAKLKIRDDLKNIDVWDKHGKTHEGVLSNVIKRESGTFLLSLYPTHADDIISAFEQAKKTGQTRQRKSSKAAKSKPKAANPKPAWFRLSYEEVADGSPAAQLPRFVLYEHASGELKSQLPESATFQITDDWIPGDWKNIHVYQEDQEYAGVLSDVFKTHEGVVSSKRKSFTFMLWLSPTQADDIISAFEQAKKTGQTRQRKSSKAAKSKPKAAKAKKATVSSASPPKYEYGDWLENMKYMVIYNRKEETYVVTGFGAHANTDYVIQPQKVATMKKLLKDNFNVDLSEDPQKPSMFGNIDPNQKDEKLMNTFKTIKEWSTENKQVMHEDPTLLSKNKEERRLAIERKHRNEQLKAAAKDAEDTEARRKRARKTSRQTGKAYHNHNAMFQMYYVA